MSHFITALHAKEVDGGWELTQALVYYSTYLGRSITVPTGFFTDLASVPRIGRILVPVANGKNRRAAVVHDRLCDPEVQKALGINQRQADRVFREALQVCGVGVIGRYTLWTPVRIYQSIAGIFS